VETAAIEDEFVKLRQMYRGGAVTEAIDAIEGDGKVWEFEKCWKCVAALLYEAWH
jgi:adenylate cyclase class IV